MTIRDEINVINLTQTHTHTHTHTLIGLISMELV